MRNIIRVGEIPVIFLMGPTGSGKTALAVELVTHIPSTIVSVDSALIYRSMNIGTAKPSAAVLEQAPHRLIDIRDPGESYSAAEFVHDARREIDDIRRAGRIPLLVGGTMLYFRALWRGLTDLPSADPIVRARLAQEGATQGWAALHHRLSKVDALSAARIKPTDPQRIQRALEVYELTGRPLSLHWQQGRSTPPPWPVLAYKLIPPDRDALRTYLTQRFDTMLEQGFIEEVRQLYQRGDLHPQLPALRCVGYRQIWRYLAGEISSTEMRLSALHATYQYAKRQLTWLRAEEGTVLTAGPSAALARICADVAVRDSVY